VQIHPSKGVAGALEASRSLLWRLGKNRQNNFTCKKRLDLIHAEIMRSKGEMIGKLGEAARRENGTDNKGLRGNGRIYFAGRGLTSREREPESALSRALALQLTINFAL